MSEAKQRVSNEQAKAAVFCFGDGLECTSECIQRGLEGCVGDMNTDNLACDLAADLLDARKERDEARAMIREMRGGLEYIDCLNVNPEMTSLSNTTRWAFASQKAKGLLKKSREYADE